MDDSKFAEFEITREESRGVREEARALRAALRDHRELLRLARVEAAMARAELVAKRANQSPLNGKIDLDQSRRTLGGCFDAMSDKPPAKPEVKPPESDEARRSIIEEYAADLRELTRKLRQKLNS
ncbi:hypothetical protein [Bradyrhizobium canariense]|uniref:Uncharacterized protein n=1 Tax=Bradyrhizobium canariense TaxID=255045 RepID=A0A1X3GDW7_9BRAD|nr:hypothetical protein [Bradyrhizobium canariense]OSI65449.1 hypothetical protein BSZ22_31640 [Bradyrhizobium canariense]OSI75769.1 hypothetical protein BSZ23_27000 [Bradyrhizobium canariense]OSI85525.1 hypothetical protein BSZ24_31130 [Bradyrhizobium canariense]OSI87108.1 hypothetical protein BSZ25_28570 [Bradyrhizobium canariense]OSI99548.1 hypothetical protein BSZ16_29620 [Bradyrhizobium canariense]